MGIKYIISVILIFFACFFWGILFVIPQILVNFTPFEIALGRYMCFGIVSMGILLLLKRDVLKKIPRRAWLLALLFCLMMNFAYYSSLNAGLRSSNPAVITLLVGISPITIALYGNWTMSEGYGKKLIAPTVLILLGLFLVNVEALLLEYEVESFNEYIFGLFCGLCSLGIWTWYAVANARFLRQNPEIDPKEWTTIVGVVTFFCTIIGIMIHIAITEVEELEKFSFNNPEFWIFLGGSFMTAVCCSWIAYSMWNYASKHIPISVMGQIAVLETIFGLIFIYAIEWDTPSSFEFWGIIVMIIGVLVGLASFGKPKKLAQPEKKASIE